MFATLMESRALPQRRTGSSIASIVAHVAIVGGATMLSAREVVTTAPARPVAHNVTFDDVSPPPRPRPAHTVVADNFGVPRPPTTFTFTVPTVTPVGIPPVDFSIPPTPSDFVRGEPGRIGSNCLVDCDGLRFTRDASGRDLWSANDVMMRLVEEPVPPRYPESLRRAGIEGTVVVQFTVDTTGRVEMGTIEVMRSTHDAFVVAVRETLAKLRFRPAISGDAKTRAVAVMPFQFTLR